jgi:hypothetical protein
VVFGEVLFQSRLAWEVVAAVIAPGGMVFCIMLVQVSLTVESFLAIAAVEWMNGALMLAQIGCCSELLVAKATLVPHDTDLL